MIVIGHSHITCLIKAAEAESAPIRHINLREIPLHMQLENDGLHPMLQRILDLAVKADSSSHIYSAVGGNVHTAVGLFKHPCPYDFIIPNHENLPLDESVEIIPYGAVAELMRDRMAVHLRILRGLATSSPSPLIHLNCPPPCKEEEFIRQTIWTSAKGRLEQAGLAPPWLRYKLWVVTANIVLSLCQKLGIQLLMPPVCTITPEGFLKREYAADAVHGNVAYGTQVLRQLNISGE